MGLLLLSCFQGNDHREAIHYTLRNSGQDALHTSSPRILEVQHISIGIGFNLSFHSLPPRVSKGLRLSPEQPHRGACVFRSGSTAMSSNFAPSDSPLTQSPSGELEPEPGPETRSTSHPTLRPPGPTHEAAAGGTSVRLLSGPARAVRRMYTVPQLQE